MTTVHESPSRLRGHTAEPLFFRFAELDHFDPDAVLDVLRGRVLGVVFRGVIDAEASRELVRRFWASPVLARRGGEVCESLGWYVGAYHFHKPTEQYLDESAEVAPHLSAILDDVPGEPQRWFRAEVDRRLRSQGGRLRLSEHDGRPGCPVLLRHWNATGAFALQPHEDSSQLDWPEQAGFEIRGALTRTVAAVNMCLENGAGGRLVVWNVVPDRESKLRLGLELSGSPYPEEVLADHESLWLQVRTGDIYVFDGAYVHGVEAGRDDAARTTMAWNMGFVDDTTVASWT